MSRKFLISLFLILALAATLCGCGKQPTPTPTPPDEGHPTVFLSLDAQSDELNRFTRTVLVTSETGERLAERVERYDASQKTVTIEATTLADPNAEQMWKTERSTQGYEPSQMRILLDEHDCDAPVETDGVFRTRLIGGAKAAYPTEGAVDVSFVKQADRVLSIEYKYRTNNENLVTVTYRFE